MKKFLFVFMFVFILSGQALADQTANTINNFAFNAGRVLAGQPGSFLFSPFSIISAFGMAYAGAAGDTAKELEAVLGFSPDIHESLGKLVSSINESEAVSSANRIWLRNRMKLRDGFKSTLLLNYDSIARELDFKKNTESARKEINRWVSEKTHGKINDIIKQLSPETRMILTNAIYFTGKWYEPFNKERTTSKPFYYNRKNSVEVPMMMQNNDFSYAESDGTKVIRLPYDGYRFSMIIVLPAEDGDIDLNAEIFDGWLEALRKHDVDLWLPKFRTERRYELKDICKALGIKIAFTNFADFSGMAEDENLKIDTVIHQTFIDVDEEKTEAAAVTSIGMFSTSAMPKETPKAEFHADRPFLYFIVDDWSRTILFMGRQTFE